MLLQHRNTRVGEPIVPVERNDQEIGKHLRYGRFDLPLVLYLAYDLNSFLIGNGRQDQFPHQSGPVCHQDSDTLHVHPARTKVFGQRLKLKSPHWGGIEVQVAYRSNGPNEGLYR